MGTYTDRGGHYIDMDVVVGRHDERHLTELLDDNDDGQPDDIPFNKCREAAEKEFEGYAKAQSQYPIPVIDSDGDVPIQAETWITNLFLFHVYMRRPDAITADISDLYNNTKLELQRFADKGIPVLITFPEIAPGSFNEIKNNMSEEDLGTDISQLDHVVSQWKGIL